MRLNIKKIAISFVIIIISLFAFNYVFDNASLSYAPALNLTLSHPCNEHECFEKVILASGEILPGSYNTFKNELKMLDKNINTICFDSPGGNNDAAQEIAKYINRNGYNTCVAFQFTTNDDQKKPSKCNSSCPYIFMSGIKRIYYGDALILGMHSSAEYSLMDSILKRQPKELSESEKETYKAQWNSLIDSFSENPKWSKIPNPEHIVEVSFKVPNKKILSVPLNRVFELNIATAHK